MPLRSCHGDAHAPRGIVDSMPRVLIALGSNSDDRAAQLDAAVAAIEALPQTDLIAKSSWLESAPVGGPLQPAYLNGAVLIETSLGPSDLFERLRQIEDARGRVRTVRWGPRTLDLDLLLYGDFATDSERLTLPHPRLAFRRFVLEPAAQIAPGMVHPTTGMTISELLARLASTPSYLAIMGPPGSGKTRLAAEIARQTGCRVLYDPAGNSNGGVSSASPELAREIEFLARRSRLIARDQQVVNTWAISDFWLAQSLAWSEAEHGGELKSQVEAAYERHRVEAMPARFLAVIDVGRSPGSTPGTMGAGLRERLRGAMRALAGERGQPPVVWLSSGDWEGAVAELLAVLAG